MTRATVGRKVEILDTLAEMLCDTHAGRVTTAALAARLGISEAGLYRHYRSKADMFDALISRVESQLFEDLNHSSAAGTEPQDRLHKQVHALLLFAERHRGLARILTGHALVHEDLRLQQRVHGLIGRFEGLLSSSVEQQPGMLAQDRALGPLLMRWVTGRWLAYVQSGWLASPTAGACEELALVGRREQTRQSGSR